MGFFLQDFSEPFRMLMCTVALQDQTSFDPKILFVSNIYYHPLLRETVLK